MSTRSIVDGWHDVPLMHEVDVLVLGGGSGAVAAALEAGGRGARVLAVSDRSYFGEDLAGTLRYDEPGACDDPLYQRLWGQGQPRLAYPGWIKHQLERALLDAGIGFVFGARPIAVLRDGSGSLRGVVLAWRTSLYAVGCGVVIDGTRHGLAARLARVPLAGRRALSPTLECVMLSPDEPRSAAFESQPLGQPFEWVDGEGRRTVAPRHRVVFARPGHGAGVAQRAAVEHQLRAALVHPTIWGVAEVMADHAGDYVAGGVAGGALVEDVAALPVERCVVDGSLLLMNSLLPLSAEAVATLDDASVQIPLGRRVGRAAAEQARQRRELTDWSQVRVDAGGDDAAGPFGFAPTFVRRGGQAALLRLALTGVAELGACDVAVAGGGTGGAAAGIAAARAEAETIVLEAQHGLGGVGTLGMIACYWYGNRVGFTEELDRQVNQVMGRADLMSTKPWNPYVKDVIYQRTLRDAGGAAWLGSFAFGVQREGDRVTGLLVSTPFGSGLLRTGAVVDATGNADVAAAAGARCRVIDHRHVAVQGTGLPPRQPGTDYRNTDHTFVDDSDVVGVTHAYVNARAKFHDEFDVGPLIDSRERRQIEGDLELSPLDILAQRTFPDTIVTARSNFDSHGFTVHPVFLAAPPDKKPLSAQVPFRCLLPAGLEGVLVTGLGISAHRDALPVVRMQADVQNQGYAAGLAAARSAATHLPFRKLNLRQLQQDLVAAGIVNREVLEQGDSFPLPAAAIAAAIQSESIDHFNAAVILAHRDQSLPALREALAGDGDETRREQLALLLGLFEDDTAAPVLAGIVHRDPWDEGWNFTGMGQFGRSMSRMDALIIALSKTRSPLAVEPILAKAQALDATAAFSHCRAISIAASMLVDDRLTAAVARLLMLPGMQGHAHLNTADVIRKANGNPNETEARNLSLRELLLARGLYLAGDVDDLGRRVLETYALDLRGHYARHAKAVLDATDLDAVRQESL